MPVSRKSPLGLTSEPPPQISKSTISKPTQRRSPRHHTPSSPSKSKPKHHLKPTTHCTPSPKSITKSNPVSKPTRRSPRLSPSRISKSNSTSHPKPTPKRQPRVTIHFVRHAQSTCNLPLPRNQILNQLDPSLTEVGISQARNLRSTFPHHDKVTHVLSSPMRRTINTAVIGFKPVLKRGIKLTLWPELREYGNSASATGTELERMKVGYYEVEEGKGVDYSHLSEGWEREWSMDDDFKVMPLRILRGIWDLVEEDEADKEIVVVSHGWLLGSLVGGEMWGNAECRSFGLEGGKGWRRLVRLQGES